MNLKIVTIFAALVFFKIYSEDINDKSFVIVTATYKNKEWYKESLDSVFAQIYKKYRIIYIVDGDFQPDSDGTGAAVLDYINEKDQTNRVTLIRNKNRTDKLNNVYNAIHMCKPQEIVIMLDGDDKLYDEHVLEYLNLVYQDPNIWLTYGQYITWPQGEVGRAIQIPEYIIKNNLFRNYEFFATHLKTFYAALFHKIKPEYLKYNNNYIKYIDDVAFMTPMLEMAGWHSKFISKILYVFNNPNAQTHSYNEQLMNNQYAHICSMAKYLPLDELIF